MSAAPFLDRLRSLGVEIEVKGDRLRCSAPKGVLTAALRAELAEQKGEILTFLKRTERLSKLVPPPLRRYPVKQVYPLSFAQQRIWFLHHLVPDQPLYNLPEAVRVRNPLNPAALEQSINEIIRRQKVLRTKFPTIKEQPVQVVSDHQPRPLPLVDLSGLPLAEREAVAARLALEEARRSFDLIEDHLLRTALLRIDYRDHFLLLTLHHLVSDGWSTGILVREIMSLYKSYSSGERSPLPELPVQYGDYVEWQRGWLRGEVLEIQLDYWREALGGNPPALELPLDRPRPAIESFRGSSQFLVLTPTLTAEIKRLSRQGGATLFVTLLSAFKILLHRLAAQEEITIGTPVAGRNQLEVENLIGVFSNTLVLRSDLSGKPSFEHLLSKIRDMSLGAYAHQDMPFEKLVEQLHPQRDLSRNPLFQVIFILQNAPMPVRESVGLSLTSIPVEFGVALFDLTLTAVETEKGLHLTLGYNTELFDATTIQRMLIHFDTLLQSIVANPAKPISDLQLLPDYMRHQVIVEWNDTEQDFDLSSSLDLLLFDHARSSPDRIALVSDNLHLSFLHLHLCSCSLASRLRSLGVSTETPVAVFLDRSAEMVISLLGVLKSGGAYIPLDPSYPAQRMSFILRQTRPPVIITSRELTARLEGMCEEASLLCIEELEEDWQANGEQWISEQAAADSQQERGSEQGLAYIIYTSGSSGEPKGVMIEQRNLTNFVMDMRDRLGMSERDVMLGITTVMFDIFGLELYVTMSSGSRLELASGEEVKEGSRLVEKVRQRAVSVMQGTPTSWRMMIEGGMRRGDEVKVISGGEELGEEMGKELSRIGKKVWNLYGPTETTIWSSSEEVGEARERVGIGRGISNTRMYVMGREGEEVGIGVRGEIYIGGEGVGRGYRGDERKTAERYVPEARGGGRGERMYRTGDIGRYGRRGEIEYLGREDRQVKVRGYRIELGEVERVVTLHPSIREAVAVIDGEGEGRKRLVCFIVPSTSPAPTTAELRGFLQERLPDYMIPNRVVALDAIPRTPNGKIDRRSLPTADLAIRQEARELVMPRTATEQTLAEIWSDVLRMRPVGVCDDFFEIGGHSLLATQIRSRISQAFKLDMPLRYLFQKPTIAEQSELIDSMQAQLEREEMASLLSMVEKLTDEEVILELKKRGRIGPNGS